MPELPEVETVKRSLEPLVKGKIISGVEIIFEGIIKYPHPERFKEQLRGRKIMDLDRKGKYLLFFLDEDLTLIIHLRMTGQLMVCERNSPVAKYTHLIFQLSSGQDWRFTDVRKFGLVYLVPTGNWEKIKGLKNLGYEPLSEEFNLPVLKKLFAGRNGVVKVFLLDQTKIAGIGNIYADEILYEAGLHPRRNIGTLSEEEVRKLYVTIKSKLEEGIMYRGTSLKDYVDGRGEKGGFQERLKVYGRRGKSCYRCGTRLERIVVGGRGTVFCPQCQVL